MKIGLFGITALPLGKHNLKDPRLDQVHQLVEAQKKTHAQVDVVGGKDLLTCDAILTTGAALSDLLMKDLDFVEGRLGRETGEAERTVLQKIADALISEQPISAAGLTPEQQAAIAAHTFHSNRPVIVATEAELAEPDALLLRAFADGGHICYLTVGGKENRAWAIRAGETAWEAAGAIHTDIERGFIRAEVVRCEDLLAAGSIPAAREKGQVGLEGKEYIVQEGDVILFRHSG